MAFSAEYWTRISTIKHPPMRERLAEVVATLADPDEVRRSVNDPEVLLFHRRVTPRGVCAVVKRAGGIGYLITAYPADRIKRRDAVWTE